MAQFEVDLPALTGASAAVRDVRARLLAVDCPSRIAAIAAAMPGSAVASVAVAVADEIFGVQNRAASDLERTASDLDASAGAYHGSDDRSAQRSTPAPARYHQRLGGPS